MAQIYFGINSLTIPVGSTFELGVFLDSEGESIAASESTIFLPPTLELVDIRDGNSMLNFWLERPAPVTFTSEEQNPVGSGVHFSGITPSGFKGDRGEIMILVVKAVGEGENVVEAIETQLLLNDGQGTPAEISPAPLGFTTVAEGEVTLYETPEDTDPPEAFTPLLANESQFGGWVVVFATQDKGSGVAYYEVKEGWGSWRVATSPWLLQDQALHKAIKVRAVDEVGNVQVARIEPPDVADRQAVLIFCGILIAVLLVTAVILKTRRLWRRQRSR